MRYCPHCGSIQPPHDHRRLVRFSERHEPIVMLVPILHPASAIRREENA
jgi:hypothetical protein